MEAGFGRASLWKCFDTHKILADEMDIRAMVVRGDGCSAAVLVGDVLSFTQPLATRLRQKVAADTGLKLEHIALHTTQNHSGPGAKKHLDEIEIACVDATRAALKGLTPVEMAQVTVHPDQPLNFCRRVVISDYGAFTVWYGQRNADGKADVTHLIRQSFAFLKAEGNPAIRAQTITSDEDYNVPETPIPVPAPVYLAPAKDDSLQALFFRTLDGMPVGTLVRFPTHPVTANFQGNFASGDYPAYVRRQIEQLFGGTSVFMTGPCADSCPMVERKSIELARSLGTKIADHAFGALKGAAWKRDGKVAACSPQVVLRTRKDIPKSVEEATSESKALRNKIGEMLKNDLPLHQVKKLAERIETLGYVTNGTFQRWVPLETKDFADAHLPTTLFVLRIGDSAIAGLPGELFNAYSARLRQETIGDALIVGEQCNAGFAYIPTAAAIPEGSYEVNASSFDERAEETLIQGIKDGLRQVGL
jgi:hypothetical protein